MKKYYLMIFILFFNQSVLSQDSVETKLYEKKYGLGGDLFGIASGLHAMYYNNAWLFGFTYGFSKTDIYNDKIIEHKGAILFRGAYAIGYIHGDKIFWPIYVGVGYMKAFEKGSVGGIKGDGSVTGITIYTGLRMFEHNVDFLSGFGSFLELGYTKWNYNNSVFNKQKSTLAYGYPAFFFCIGLCYYF